MIHEFSIDVLQKQQKPYNNAQNTLATNYSAKTRHSNPSLNC